MNLAEYQNMREKEHSELCLSPSKLSNVTILAYFFRNPEEAEKYFRELRIAIMETWRHCGLLKTMLVVNRIDPCVEAFAADHSDWVSVVASEELKAGQINSMSIDCNLNMHKYFETEYVLVIQDDGFPLRSGLEDFVGKWDYIGAPFEPSNSWIDFYTFTYPRGAVGNGGFSLRSHRICEMASYYYNRYYKRLPFLWLMNEDIFFCRTMPFFSWKARRELKFPSREEASLFSVEKDLRFLPKNAKPFGFHSPKGFERITSRGIS